MFTTRLLGDAFERNAKAHIPLFVVCLAALKYFHVVDLSRFISYNTQNFQGRLNEFSPVDEHPTLHSITRKMSQSSKCEPIFLDLYCER